MKNTNTQNSAMSQRRALHNIATPFANWLNVRGVQVIKWGRKARDPKREAIATRAEVRYAKAEAFAREILRPIVELTVNLASELPKRKRTNERFKTFARYSKQIDPMLKNIAEQFPTQPQLSNFSDLTGTPEFRFYPIRKGRDYAKALAVSERLEQFFWLTAEGACADFRRCALPTCAKYFYPLRPERLYCSTECQRTHYKQSLEYKLQNRKYQREYYRDNLSVEAKQKELQRARSRTAHRRS